MVIVYAIGMAKEPGELSSEAIEVVTELRVRHARRLLGGYLDPENRDLTNPAILRQTIEENGLPQTLVPVVQPSKVNN